MNYYKNKQASEMLEENAITSEAIDDYIKRSLTHSGGMDIRLMTIDEYKKEVARLDSIAKEKK